MNRVLVLVSLSGHMDLLEQFISYYSGLGAEAFLVHINDEAGDGAFVRRARDVLARVPHTITDVWTGRYDCYRKTRHDARALERFTSAGDWVLVPDLDEFQEYSVPVEDLLSSCDERGWNCVRGHFVDRLARGGELPRLRTHECLFSQFPYIANVTGPVLGAQTRMVAAVRGVIPQNRHYTDDGTVDLNGQPLSFCPSEDVKAHHFKWSRNAVIRMQSRYECYKQLHEAGSEAFGFYEEGKRFLDRLAQRDGRFDLDDPALGSTLDGRCPCKAHPVSVQCRCKRS